MKPSRNIFDAAAHNGTTEQEPDFIFDESGRYYKSYDALSDALIAIFERVYLPQEVMGRNPKTGALIYTDAGLARFEELKDRFMVAMQDDDEKGHLKIEICPASYKGLSSTGLGDLYIDGPAEIKQTISAFFSELNEIVAGIEGVRVSPQHHTLSVAGPQPFLAMIIAICDAKNIATAESAHTKYAMREQAEERDGDPSKPGHYNKPFLDILKKPRATKKADPDILAGVRFRQLVGNTNVTNEIPAPVFKTMGAQAYGLREIGHLINKFNNEGVIALFSVNELQAIVDQDLAKSSISKNNPFYNLH